MGQGDSLSQECILCTCDNVKRQNVKEHGVTESWLTPDKRGDNEMVWDEMEK